MPGKTVFLDMVSYDNQHKIKKLTLSYVNVHSNELLILVTRNYFSYIIYLKLMGNKKTKAFNPALTLCLTSASVRAFQKLLT